MDDPKYTNERVHQENLNRVDYSQDYFINARMTSEKVLLIEGGTLYSQSNGFDNTSLPGDTCMKKTHTQ
jgi:hypothetical protein